MQRTHLARFLAVWAAFLALAGGAAAPASPPKAPSRGVVPLPQKQVQASPAFDRSQSAGIFVGVRSYDPQQTNLSELPYAVDDAIDLAYLFALELRLVEPSRVRLLLAGGPYKPESAQNLLFLTSNGATVYSADHSSIIQQLGIQASQAGAAGLFVVAFAGHGVSEHGVDYLLASDFADGRLAKTSVKVHEALETITGAKTTRRIVFLDSCRAVQARGPVPDSRFVMSEELALALALSEGDVILSASRPHGFAYDDNDRKNGVFTAAVLDVLRCQREFQDFQGTIRAGQLAAFVHQRVDAWEQVHHAEIQARGIESRLAGGAANLPLAQCPREIPSPCDEAQLDFVEINAGPAGVRRIDPSSTELTLSLQELGSLKNLTGRASLSWHGARIESCPCRWSRLDEPNVIDSSSCIFSVPVPQGPAAIALRLEWGDGSSTPILLQLK
ncbi:MAG TPA: caspase family protein [Thermoanaerobaculia bacterium]|nr:caspase family protein [Thermoanaerobaculia bacterium]